MNTLLPTGRLPTRTSVQNASFGITTVGILAFAVCCLLSSAHLLWNTPDLLHLSVDDIAARSDQRFAALKAQLPGRGVVGYIGESGNSGTAGYYLAQYALAPLVVDRSPNHALVIGSFPDSLPDSPLGNLQLIQNFGNGVLLFAGNTAKNGDATYKDAK
jgi:hypothetical protein